MQIDKMSGISNRVQEGTEPIPEANLHNRGLRIRVLVNQHNWLRLFLALAFTGLKHHKRRQQSNRVPLKQHIASRFQELKHKTTVDGNITARRHSCG